MGQELPDYYDNLNIAVLEAIPADAGLVLEFGCGAGRLGLEFKKFHPASRYYGVELHPQAAAVAATRLDMTLCAPAEDADFGFLSGQVDCIVYADVLEHLVDPWSVLKRHRDLLKPGGRIVASIPNIQHWSVLALLMAGIWDYQDNGVMDRTHLRFFTLGGIRKMFDAAGLDIDDVQGTIVPAAEAKLFFDVVAPVVPALGFNEETFRKQAEAYQYLVTASRRD